jgi:hypothetical protein
VTETKIACRSIPRDGFDRNKSDEVLDIAVKLVRTLQVYRRTGDRADLKGLRPHEDAMRLHFPSLSRGEVHRLANVLVHIGSMALRHALGMKVVVPGSPEGLEAPPRITRDSQGRLLNIRLEDGTLMALEDALLQLFKEHPRMTASEAAEQMRSRGWTHLFAGKNSQSSIRDYMRKSPSFRLCHTRKTRTFGGRGGYLVFRAAKR